MQNGILTIGLQKPRSFRIVRGTSIAVNGVCSTVARMSTNTFTFEYMPETLRKTNLQQLRKGDVVNLEASLTPSSLLDGHFVMGHVDTVGRIAKIVREGASRTFTITIPKSFLIYIAPKGSVAVEGVSLTVVQKAPQEFTVSLIPYTLTHTNLSTKKVGDTVNLEFDILAKYIAEQSHARKRR